MVAPNQCGEHDHWPRPRSTLTLRQDDVHVWLADLDLGVESVAAFRNLLSVEELQRAAHFRLPRVRDNFLCARGQLRILLGRYLDVSPSEVPLRYNPYGKPCLDGDFAGRLHFNLAHSHGLVLYAVRGEGEVGVDIEYMSRDVAFNSIALQFFSAGECAALAALPPNLQRRAFFDGWVRKEAYVKAVGKGLHISLSDFTVSLSPGQPVQILDIKGDLDISRWRLSALAVPRHYVAAVVIEGERLRLNCWRYPLEWTKCTGDNRDRTGPLPVGGFDDWPAFRMPNG